MKTRERTSYERAFLRYLVAGERALSGEDREQIRAMGTQDNASGGAIVPETWLPEMFNEAAEDFIYGSVTRRPCANKLHVSSIDNVSITGVAQESDGGTIAPQVSPNVNTFTLTAVDEEHPTGQGALVLRNWPAIAKVSRSLFEDAEQVESLDVVMPRTFGRSIAKEINRQFFKGAHSSTEIMGLVGTAGVVPGRVVTAASATAVAEPDLGGMLDKLSPKYFVEAEWACSPSGLLKAKAGGVMFEGVDARGRLLLYGRPVNLTANLDNVVTGTKYSWALYAPKRYILAESRSGISVQRLDEVYATTGQVGYQLQYRVDGSIIDPDAFTLLKHT